MSDDRPQPRSVECPVCGAKPGEPCNTRPLAAENLLQGNPGRSHPERFEAARGQR